VLPWLMLLGRVLLQWAQLLQQQVQYMQRGEQGFGARKQNAPSVIVDAETVRVVKGFDEMGMFEQLPVAMESCITWLQLAEVQKHLEHTGFESATLL
jgi:hypothetical protein